MKTVRVLITGAGAPGCPSILNCLRNNEERSLYIVGVDMNPMATCRKKVDRFYQVPPAYSPDFIDTLLDICRKEKIDVVIPIVTRELELFSKSKLRFEEIGTKVSVMNEEPLHIANNKGLLLERMREAGLPTPKFEIARTADTLIDAIEKLGYPQKAVVVKPTFGNGSRGTRILDAAKSKYDLFFFEKPNSMYISYSELVNTINEKPQIPEMIVMEYLPGMEICVDALADDGKVLYVSSREGDVVSSIMVSSRVTYNESAIDLAKKIISLLKLDGNIDFDMKIDDYGVPQIMEINPRLPSGVVVQAAAGVNFPYLRIKQLLGEKMPMCKAVTGFEMQFRNEEVLYDPDGNLVKWEKNE